MCMGHAQLVALCVNVAAFTVATHGYVDKPLVALVPLAARAFTVHTDDGGVVEAFVKLIDTLVTVPVGRQTVVAVQGAMALAVALNRLQDGVLITTDNAAMERTCVTLLALLEGE